jgi:hypothetical protein
VLVGPGLRWVLNFLSGTSFRRVDLGGDDWEEGFRQGVAPQLYNWNFVTGYCLPPSTPSSHALPLPPPAILRVFG